MKDEQALLGRIEKLEELLAHQSLAVDEMSDELMRLKHAHADLAQRHKALVTRLQEFEEAAGDAAPPRYEKPPHY